VLLESLHTEKSEAKLNVVIRDELLSMKKEDFIKIEQIQMEYVLNSEQIKTDTTPIPLIHDPDISDTF
jgi:hypothetical protein